MAEWTINEEEAKKIIETEPRQIIDSKVFNAIHLSKEERIEHAKEIFEKWKNQKD